MTDWLDPDQREAAIAAKWAEAEARIKADEALLRQALDALKSLTDYSTDTSDAERMGNAAIAAMRERLKDATARELTELLEAGDKGRAP